MLQEGALFIMGVPMSKTDQSSSELDDGRLFEKCREDDTDVNAGKLDTTRKQPLKDKPGLTVIPKSMTAEKKIVQTLYNTDDILDDSENNIVSQRLKPNKVNDLHAANTRFKPREPGKSTTGPVFTSSVTQRSTRVDSANFSPHSVSFDTDNTILKLAHNIHSSGEAPEEEMSSERPAAPVPPAIVEDDGREPAVEQDQNNGNPDATKTYVSEPGHKSNPTKQDIAVPPHSSRDHPKPTIPSLLTVPEDVRNIHSPVPVPGQTDEVDIDPFEGMDIPRERVYSMGSASVYSVKEISDRQYQEYFYEVRNCIRNYGFFEKFPTPSVVSDAQRTYRQMDIPTPVDDEGNILPHPPKITKEDVFASQTKSFTEIDHRIINAPDRIINGSDTVDVVNYLCVGLDDDLSKIRAISTWIAIRQMQETGNQKPVSPEEWCKKFRAMCRCSRIKTKLVKGIIRGPGYIPGEEGETQSGVWISVLVNSTWWPVDPVIHKASPGELARGSGQNGHNADQSSLFCHAESFFWDPEQFIFTHYPDEEYWQLLARPITREEFADLAVLSHGFFALRMKLISPTKAVIVVKKEETTVSIGYPENSMRQFKCKLYLRDGEVTTESAQGPNNKTVKLRRFVFLETRLDKHKLNATVRFPQRGSYILELFGSAETQPWQRLCSYKIVNESVNVASPYPVNTREEWGPGFDTLRLGLRPITHKSGEIVISGGVEQIALKDSKGLQFRHDFLRHDGKVIGNSDTTKISVLKDKDNSIVFCVDINESLLGTYVLQLYAKSGPNKPFQNFCNYFIRRVEAEKRVVPRYQFSRVEVQEEARVTMAPVSGQLTREVDASSSSQLVVDLKLHDRQELNFSEHARHWIKDDLGFVELNFPRKGQYSVKVLGRNVVTNHFQTLLEENIQVDVPSERWSSFPKTESGWSSFYKVERPLTHHLPEKEYVDFSVAIKEAQDVAVLAPNGWYHLILQEDGFWDGKIWTGPKSTKCRLLARFEIGSEKFTDLLWFKVMSEDDFDSMEDRQETLRERALKEYQKHLN